MFVFDTDRATRRRVLPAGRYRADRRYELPVA